MDTNKGWSALPDTQTIPLANGSPFERDLRWT